MHSHHTEGWYDLSRILRTWSVCRKMMVASIDWYLGLIVGQDHFCLFISDITLWIWGTFSIYGFRLGVNHTFENSCQQSADYWCVCVRARTRVRARATPRPSTVATL